MLTQTWSLHLAAKKSPTLSASHNLTIHTTSKLLTVPSHAYLENTVLRLCQWGRCNADQKFWSPRSSDFHWSRNGSQHSERPTAFKTKPGQRSRASNESPYFTAWINLEWECESPAQARFITLVTIKARQGRGVLNRHLTALRNSHWSCPERLAAFRTEVGCLVSNPMQRFNTSLMLTAGWTTDVSQMIITKRPSSAPLQYPGSGQRDHPGECLAHPDPSNPAIFAEKVEDFSPVCLVQVTWVADFYGHTLSSLKIILQQKQ